jgi:hypothetical protein
MVPHWADRSVPATAECCALWCVDAAQQIRSGCGSQCYWCVRGVSLAVLLVCPGRVAPTARALAEPDVGDVAAAGEVDDQDLPWVGGGGGRAAL